jgi:large conductance mechanosensitive channel
MLKQFRDFIMRGNVLDLAVAVVVGAAFNTVVQSLVDNVINPIAAGIFGKPDFREALVVSVRDADVRFGAWITDVVSFLIVAFSVFLVIKLFEKLQSVRKTVETDADTPAPSDETVLLTEIRDLLRTQAR